MNVLTCMKLLLIASIVVIISCIVIFQYYRIRSTSLLQLQGETPLITVLAPLIIDMNIYRNEPIPTQLKENETIEIKDWDSINTIVIKKLPQDGISTCYEMRKIDDDESLIEFCYPSINVAGIPKCGTSSMFNFLSKQSGFDEAVKNHKEYCPTKLWGSTYDYFSRFPSRLQLQGKYHHVNGCINPQLNVFVHNLLNPVAIYIIVVRELSSQIWADYNFWCIKDFDGDCKPGQHVDNTMYRDPIMFDQLLKSVQNGGRSLLPFQPCQGYETYYENILKPITSQNIPLLLIPMEGFNDSHHIRRIETFINKNFKSSIILDPKKMQQLNKNAQDDNTPNTYAISSYRPILNSSRDFIQKCWKECEYISTLSQHKYDCAAE